MCHVIGQQQAEPEPRGSAAPPFPGRLRPRWGAVAGAALIGGFALAFVAPSSAPPLPDVKPAAAVTPVVARTAAPPSGGAVEQGAGLDDGVPTTTGMSKAGLGNCHHGM